MASITIIYPDAWKPIIENGFARKYGYQERVANPAFETDPTVPPTIPNPMDKEAFARLQVLMWVRNQVVQDNASARHAVADTEVTAFEDQFDLSQVRTA